MKTKKNRLILSIVFILSFMSCKDDKIHSDKGSCTACCDALGKTVCKSAFTKAECADYNSRKVDGYSWTFNEGAICDPQNP